MRSNSKKIRIDGDEDSRSPDGGYQIKTYYPTMDDMKNFSAYVKFIHDDGGARAGLAKIVPPPQYKPRKAGYGDDKLYDMDITCPIKQEVSGESGLYQQLNLVEKKKMSVRNFKRLAEEKYPTPMHKSSEELERIFWKNIFTQPSIYGADVSGSLYDDDVEEFNLTRLNTILDNIGQDYGVTIQGVNTAYLYFGMWKTSFCWHTEDMDLYSINYLHYGSPKAWYCISPEHGKRFERLAASFFPHSFRTCKAFLRHKTTLISPQVLKKYSVPFSRCVQEAGQFMITFPFSYHSGFNHGFNIAEATNFALEHWIEFGKWATKCECSTESVKISMQTFVKRYQSERYEKWLKGKDIGPDPRDPKHVGCAPKPTEYDLYLMGTHIREPEAEETKKVALQQNQLSNVKPKTKTEKQGYPTLEETFQRYTDLFLQNQNHNSYDINMQLPQYPNLSSQGSTSDIANMQHVPSEKMDYINDNQNTLTPPNQSQSDKNKALKAEAKRKRKEELLRLKREKRAKEAQVMPKTLLQFSPLTFTHEKRFNRCIAASPPHCSVCQLLELHPKDNEDIWGPFNSHNHTSEPAQAQNANSTLNQQASNGLALAPNPAPIRAGPKVEDFKLPESSPVLIPRIVFSQKFSLPRIDHDSSRSDNESLKEDKLDFLELDLTASQLLQCSVCMLCVHMACYGVKEKKTDWICDRCRQDKNRSLINCELCPCRGGALKEFKDNWAHITCVLTVPDTGIGFIDLIHPERSMTPKLKVPERVEHPCIYCSTQTGFGKYTQGKCITCTAIYYHPVEGRYVPCGKVFHATCAHRYGAKFELRDFHEDPNIPIQATCESCLKMQEAANSSIPVLAVKQEVERQEQPLIKEKLERDLTELANGTRVVALSKNGLYYDAEIENRITSTYIEVFYPNLNEVETNISTKKVVDYDPSRQLLIGDEIKIKGYREGVRTGKYKGQTQIEEYSVRFLVSEELEKVARHDIYLNQDELPEEYLPSYKACIVTETTPDESHDESQSENIETPANVSFDTTDGNADTNLNDALAWL